MKRVALVVGLAMIAAVCVPARSDAAAIGVIEWSVQCGATDGTVSDCFGVTNFSDISDAPVDFTNVAVSLFRDAADATPFDTLETGIDGLVPIAGFAQTTEPLPAGRIGLATLTMGNVLFRLLDVDTGAEIAGLTLPGQIATIDRVEQGQPIPEPATLLLMGTAMAIGSVRRRRRA